MFPDHHPSWSQDGCTDSRHHIWTCPCQKEEKKKIPSFYFCLSLQGNKPFTEASLQIFPLDLFPEWLFMPIPSLIPGKREKKSRATLINFSPLGSTRQEQSGYLSKGNGAQTVEDAAWTVINKAVIHNNPIFFHSFMNVKDIFQVCNLTFWHVNTSKTSPQSI